MAGRAALVSLFTMLALAAGSGGRCYAELKPVQNSSQLNSAKPGSPQNSSSDTAFPPGESVYTAKSSSSLGTIFEYQGLRVRQIEFRGIPSGNVARLRDILPQKIDEPLDRSKISGCVRALFATGRFADVLVEADRTSQTEVSLVFVASQNFFVGLVTIEGVPKDLTENQLVNASKLQLGELFTEEKLQLGLEHMTQILQQNGYYRATIEHREDHDPTTQQVNITFHIGAGEQARVGRVTIKGNPGYTPMEALEIAHLHPGDPISSQLITNALQRLRKKYQKKDRLEVRVSMANPVYRPENNTVDYVLEIRPGPVVDVRVQGAKIRKGTLKKYVPVYEEGAVDEDLLNEGRRNLRNYLQTRGYFEAEVNLRPNFAANEDHVQIVYLVNRGIRHRLSDIIIIGNMAEGRGFPADVIRERMRIQAAGRVLTHGLFSQELLSRDVASIEELYRANGFEQVKIESSVQDDYKGEKGRIAVTIQITPGPQTLVAALHIVGNKAIPETEMLSLLANIEGQPYSESNIAQDRDSVLSDYFNRGFPNAQFAYTAKPLPGGPNRMEVTYSINEGERFFVREVLIDGLNYTRPYVAQRELSIQPGDPLSQNEMLDSQRRLYDLGIFNQVDTAVQNPTGTAPDKNVIFRTQEAKRYTFTYGLGFEVQTGQPSGATKPQGETGASPRVSFDLTRLNFRGRGHTISFKSHLGRLQQRAVLSYDAPRLFNNPALRFTFTTFYDNSLDVLTFTSQRLEGSAQIQQKVSKVTTLAYGFTYRRVRASNLVISSALVPVLSLPVRVGMPTFTYIRDKRDNPIQTHKGNYTTLDAGLAAGFFGSQASFGRLLVQNSTYHSFLTKNKPVQKQWVFARSTRVGVENQFGSSPTVATVAGGCPGTSTTLEAGIPLPERFLAGGGNSDRGFAINQAGPRDPCTGAPLGGGAVFINNLEMRTPPVLLPFVEDNLSLVLFHDAGNVFATPRDILKGLRFTQDKQGCQSLSQTAVCNFNYLSHAVGAGVRYRTPIGPLRVDFGYNLNPPVFPVLQGDQQNSQPHVETARHFNFFFSIGQTF